MTAPDTPYQVRRAPTQYRATRQIERILDAASRVALEKGFSATTADIAKAAKVSIGSVYRYFPDKLAVMKAIIGRNTVRYQQRIQIEIDLPAHPTWPDAVGRAYDIYVEMWRTDEGFRAVGGAGVASSVLETSGELIEPLTETMVTVLVHRYGFVDRPELRVSMLQSVAVGEVLTKLAFRLTNGGHEETLAQARRTICDLVAPYAPVS